MTTIHSKQETTAVHWRPCHPRNTTSPAVTNFFHRELIPAQRCHDSPNQLSPASDLSGLRYALQQNALQLFGAPSNQHVMGQPVACGLQSMTIPLDSSVCSNTRSRSLAPRESARRQATAYGPRVPSQPSRGVRKRHAPPPNGASQLCSEKKHHGKKTTVLSFSPPRPASKGSPPRYVHPHSSAAIPRPLLF